MRRWAVLGGILAVALGALVATSAAGWAHRTPATLLQDSSSTVFAIIGDYGRDDANEAAVADLVKSWTPAYIITTGDDYYSEAGLGANGATDTMYDESTGAYYGAWLKDITTSGTRCPVGGAVVNAFFPAMGNHDYTDATPAPSTYLDYFTLPGDGFTNSSGNERYYDFVQGPVHFFALNSNSQEPDGTGSASNQAKWLQAQLSASTSSWNIVYDHHPPYSSDSGHGSTASMQWPFASWGADVVASGHAHVYERVMRDGIVYFVNGLGGDARYTFGAPVSGSAVRYNADWGAQRVTATSDTLTFEFFNTGGTLIDSYTLAKPPSAPAGLTAAATSSSTIDLAWADTSDDETGFKVERALGAGAYTQIALVGADVTSYVSAGLAGGTSYSYRVRACNAAGDSPYSNTAAASTFAAPPLPPSSLAAAALSSTAIRLTWVDGSSDESGFELERSVDGGGTWSTLPSVGAGVTTFQDTGLVRTTTYTYRVRAVNAAGSSAWSDTTTATTLAPTPIHVGDLDGARTIGTYSWTAKVTITVHDAAHHRLPGATVRGYWGSSSTHVVSALTGTRGTCTLARKNLSLGTGRLRFTVTRMTKAGCAYAAPSNHDADGGSTGTVIIVRR